jgi:peroxiredoxin
MKKLSAILLLCFATLFSNAQQIDTTTRTKVGDLSPNFSFNISKDKVVSLSDYRGKIVVLDFFATWCPPCRMELPRVQKEIWEKYKADPKFALFAFDREENWDKLLPFKQKNHFSFPMVPDMGRVVFSLYASQSIPRLIVIDEKGKIIYQSIGYTEKDFSELLALLADKLK